MVRIFYSGEGKRVLIKINGETTVDWTEPPTWMAYQERNFEQARHGLFRVAVSPGQQCCYVERSLLPEVALGKLVPFLLPLSLSAFKDFHEKPILWRACRKQMNLKDSLLEAGKIGDEIANFCLRENGSGRRHGGSKNFLRNAGSVKRRFLSLPGLQDIPFRFGFQNRA